MGQGATPGLRRANGVASEGYERALDAIRSVRTDDGFLATPTDRSNYRRVWARDGSITGLAALLSGDPELVAGCRRTLETLARYQGPHGEIPSNVDPLRGEVSYGGTAGRVDAGLWFVIACSEYGRRTGDVAFLRAMGEPLARVRFLLGAWEFNGRGLLYVPATGDWADEYLHSGYVLYDQLLYLQALRGIAWIHRRLHGRRDEDLVGKIAHLEALIRANYWFEVDGDAVPEHAYHPQLFEKGRRAAENRRGSYWMPFFSPHGYGYNFDGLANALVSLLGVADEDQAAATDQCIESEIVQDEVRLLPAFDPVIRPQDETWHSLQMTFSHGFKNEPYEFHNGGLWPLVTGFYVASLAKRGRGEAAARYLEGVHAANRSERDGKAWSFPEYLHGRSHEPKGTSGMAWSAAAAVIAERYVRGDRLFGESGEDAP